MSKSLHNRHNKIYLDKLRELREQRQLRQADLGQLLGRSQSWVSNVECGETALNIIELREWLDALNYRFMRFVKELDAELRRVESLSLRAKPPFKVRRGGLIQLVRGLPLGSVATAPAASGKTTKRGVRG